MSTSPEAVYVFIPCMKELGMSWSEIKQTPRHELTGLLMALNNYNIIHQFDGYTSQDISELSKNKPQVKSDYNRSIALKRKYEMRAGKSEKIKSFNELGL